MTDSRAIDPTPAEQAEIDRFGIYDDETSD